MQGLTQKTEGGQSPGSDWRTAGSPDSPAAPSDMWGFGAGGEMSTALLHESIKHVFLLYVCSLFGNPDVIHSLQGTQPA